ncbi:MAG: secreted protein containing PKD domain protein [Candidatus Syntrophoarchaeum caldarius]|uniref:Secreted protein containing PKD domain protein n=1 Tax=Candidatus Syntropharchaeum caldarium TaxID=1838285 RepID=A0A1F2PA62_9EURY|nr:MAG: secreted protein containing PKD domain protein [Candidatus Syntrophoarchaeum caldarius]
MRRGVLLIFLFLIALFAIISADAGKTYLASEDLGRRALAKAEAEGWKVLTVEIYLDEDWAKMPALTAGETVSLTGQSYYYMEMPSINAAKEGACPEEVVHLEIYRDDRLLNRYEGTCDPNGNIKFDLEFAEPGYYGYKIYTAWQMENNKIPDHPTSFFVRPRIAEGEDSKSWIVVDFAFTPSGPAPGDGVIFTDRSQYRMTKVASWHWDFGDGTNSTERDCEHAYQQEGTYTVTLTLKTEDGESHSKSKEIVVKIPPELQPTEESPSMGLYASLLTIFLMYFAKRHRR